jgi:glycosyltransferase involved in cell wall biosynthesis
MKVLIINYTNNIVSGAELAIKDMVYGLGIKDVNFIFYTPGQGVLTSFFEDANFQTWSEFYTGPRRLYPGLFFISSLILARKLTKMKVDLIVYNTFAASHRFSLAANFAKIPSIIYLREYYDKNKKENLLQLKRCKFVFAVSKDVRNYIGNDHSSIKVAYDYFQPNLNQLRVNGAIEKIVNYDVNDSKHICFLGRITKYKMPELVILAQDCMKEKGLNWQVHIIGSSTPNERYLMDKLVRMVEDLGLTGRVHFYGYVKEPLVLLQQMDVLCVTSDREPFPRVILEGMAIGVPVVASNTGGCLEMVQHEINGLLFDVLDSEPHVKLAQQIERLLNDTLLRERIIFEGEKFITNNPFWRENKEKFISLIREAVQ